MWQPLFANIAACALMMVAWTSCGEQVARLRPLVRQLLFGLVMAVGAVGSMRLSYQIEPGVHFDIRGPLIAVSGFFGGPFAAAITAGAAAIYRFMMGGAVTTGMIGIAASAFVGVGGYVLRRQRRPQVQHLLYLAIGMALTNLLAVASLPALQRAIMLDQISTTILVSAVATLGLGAVLMREERRLDLARSNQLYRSMVDTLPDCLNIKDVNGVFLAANPATARLMRAADVDDLVGKSDFDFYPAELAAAFHEDEVAALEGGEPTTIEQFGQRPDGSRGWLSTLKAPVHDDDGRLIGLVTHNRDITAKKELEFKLTETQAYLDLAMENMNDGLAIYDPNGVILFCNSRYRALFPKTSHLRRTGNHFGEIMRASVAQGEEALPPGTSIDDHVADKMAALKRPGEEMIQLSDGRTFAVLTKVLPDGCTLRMMSDVTERRSFERSLEHQALHDALTGLPNRAYFNRELARLLAKARKDGGELAVMLLDLDRFKQVNDNFGHAAGDALLSEVSNRLAKSMRQGDFAARLGGDEFAVLMPAQNLGDGDVGMATRLVKTLGQPMKIGDVTLLPGATIGYTIYPRDNSNADDLLKNADTALYRAKAKGRGTWASFDVRMLATAAKSRA